MQEEVENRTVNLAISTTKLTFRTIVNGYNAWKRHHQAKVAQKTAQLPVGKQSIKELIGQNQGVSSIPIEKTDLKGFEQVARKYGVDYAITKDQNVIPPKYTVFFKAKDADALTSAFEEFTNRKLKAREKPSVLEQLMQSSMPAYPFRRKGGISMTCTKDYREHIEYTFHAFCKVVIRNATITAARARSRKYKREISLESCNTAARFALPCCWYTEKRRTPAISVRLSIKS